MSYILDALKKIDKEKTRKASGAGMVSISGELFKDERRISPAGAPWKIAVVVVAASLVTFGTTWFFLKADKTKDVVKPDPAPLVSVSRPVNPPAPAVTASASTTPPQTSPLVAAPAPLTGKKSVSLDTPVAKITASSTRNKTQHILKRPVSPALNQADNVVSTPPPSNINVSGIAWQDERSARRAVINGFLMQEGGSVSSAKVSEIFQDRVRFSQAGRTFDVYLPISGSPVLAK